MIAVVPLALFCALAVGALPLVSEVPAAPLAAARQSIKKHGLSTKILTVIDYTRASTQKRLWVIDLEANRVLFYELVAHGKNTGANRAKHFSNESGSLKSSLGLFQVEETYSGKHGYSVRLSGLDRGLNHHARARAIVMHGAWYVSEAFAKQHGRLGRSWGCPAVRKSVVKPLIGRIKGRTLLFAYGGPQLP